jgi:hypothetical protein
MPIVAEIRSDDHARQAKCDAETWDRVQALLASHTRSRNGPTRSTEALRAGKLYDDRGHRMSPSEVCRGRGAGATTSRKPSCRGASRKLDPSPESLRRRSRTKSFRPFAALSAQAPTVSRPKPSATA